MTTKLCPVCGEVRPLSYSMERKGYIIRRCDVCGLGLTEIEDYNAVKEIYSEGYFNGERSDGYADYVGSAPVLSREFHGAVSELIRVSGAGGKLLEIGCAYGYFLRQAALHFDVEGIELCDTAVENCRKDGLRVEAGTLTDTYVKAHGPFDKIVMLDVIEHLPEPDETVALAWKALRPGGHLMISTGDWSSLLARLTGPRWRLMTPPQHLFFFSASNLASMLKRIGFEVVALTHPGKIVPLGLVLYQVRRMLGMRPSVVRGASATGIPVNLFDAMRLIARKPVN
ncbi:MAG: methyltransferase domain-containing protein [Bryobacteraceae bacterium]